VLSAEVKLEHGLVPAGQTLVVASGLVTFLNASPPRVPHITCLKNVV